LTVELSVPADGGDEALLVAKTHLGVTGRLM